MKQILWVVALLVILMTATGHLVSAAGFDWSDGTSRNACKKMYSVSFRSGRGVSSAVYEKLGKKQKFGSMITIPKVPQVPAGYQAEGWSLKKEERRQDISREKIFCKKKCNVLCSDKKEEQSQTDPAQE